MNNLTAITTLTLPEYIKPLGSDELLALWDTLLNERMGLPPNDRHAEIGKMIDAINTDFMAKAAAEREAAIAAIEAAAAESAAKANSLVAVRVDADKLVYEMRLAVATVVRAVGADRCRLAVEAAIAYELADQATP